MRPIRPTLLVLGILLTINSCSKDSTSPEEENQLESEVNLTARSQAKQLYDDYYVASRSISGDVAWSGNEPACDAGDIPQGTLDKIFMRLEYFRKAAGLNNTIVENDTKSERAQDAALMMKSNGTLDHFPPDSWKCYSDSGRDGAGNSLLTQTKNAEAIDSYIRDAGASNGPVGHRRWLLWPRLQEIGVGNTDSTNAIWVIGNPGTPPSDAPDFIAWPPPEYVPKQLVYPRWSFSIAGADFSATSISMKDGNNQSISLEIEELNTQFGDRTIVWVPTINTNAISEDTRYTVTITNVEIDGDMSSYEYQVILFDVNN